MNTRFLLYFILFILFGCSDSVDTPYVIKYSTDIQPILTNNCALSGCHAPSHDHLVSQSLNRLKHGDTSLVLSSYELVAKGSNVNGNSIIPFEPSLSHLFQHINRDVNLSPFAEPQMPNNGNTLSGKDIEKIKNWIEQGAMNDHGTPMYSHSASGSFIITNQSEDFLTIFDVETKLISRVIPFYQPTFPAPKTPPFAPHYVTVSPDKKYAYSTLYTSGHISKINLAERREIGRIFLGGTPAHVEIFDQGKQAVVSNFSNQNRVHIINLETFQLTRHISISGNPHALYVDDANYIYTAGSLTDLLYKVNSDGSGDVTSFRLSNDVPITGNITPKYQPYQIRMYQNKLYVSCKLSNEIRIFNKDTGTLEDSIGTGKNPLLFDINSLTNELWVANVGDQTISVINLSTKIVETISGLPKQPHGIKFSGNGQIAGITCENQGSGQHEHHPTTRGGSPGYFVFINAITKEILAKRETGGFAAGIDFIP